MGIGQWASWDKKLTTMSDNLWYWGCVFLIEKFRGITNKFFFTKENFFLKRGGKRSMEDGLKIGMVFSLYFQVNFFIVFLSQNIFLFVLFCLSRMDLHFTF